MNIYLEIFGYIGTALVVFSMMMTSLIKLRVINICGSIISAIYSALCNAWPIAVMNFCLILINSFQIMQKIRNKRRYGHLQLSVDDPTLQYFLALYSENIEKIFPNYRLQARSDTEIHMIYVGSEAVGVLVGTRVSDAYRIEMDYVIPKYRDLAVGKFLFPILKEQGIDMLTAPWGDPKHNRYLFRLGFEDGGGILLKNL